MKFNERGNLELGAIGSSVVLIGMLVLAAVVVYDDCRGEEACGQSKCPAGMTPDFVFGRCICDVRPE